LCRISHSIRRGFLLDNAVRILALVTVALALTLGACSRDADRYDGVRDVAAALAGADLGCSDLRMGGEAKLVAESGSCSVEGAEINIFLFKSPGDRDKWTKLGTRVEPSLLGPNWAISGSEDSVHAIADELGGEFRSSQ
jgi:hypothetical protein